MNYFINFSNHPSNTWSEEQLNAAKEYGQVIDIAFPDIPAIYRPEDLRYEVAKFAAQIKQYLTIGSHITLHIMGEMTFTYMVLDYFREYPEIITCVASTTRRMVEEKDGVKISKFEFVQFREYSRY